MREHGGIIQVVAWIGAFIFLMLMVGCWMVAHDDESLSRHATSLTEDPGCLVPVPWHCDPKPHK